MIDEETRELDFLRWFYNNADFGPADSDVRRLLKDAYTEDTGERVPEGYDREE